MQRLVVVMVVRPHLQEVEEGEPLVATPAARAERRLPREARAETLAKRALDKAARGRVELGVLRVERVERVELEGKAAETLFAIPARRCRVTPAPRRQMALANARAESSRVSMANGIRRVKAKCSQAARPMYATAKMKIVMVKLTTGWGKFPAGWAFVKLR